MPQPAFEQFRYIWTRCSGKLTCSCLSGFWLYIIFARFFLKKETERQEWSLNYLQKVFEISKKEYLQKTFSLSPNLGKIFPSLSSLENLISAKIKF